MGQQSDTQPNQPKQRKRVAKACKLCNRRKVKCDGAKQCSNCDRYNRKCVYPAVNAHIQPHSQHKIHNYVSPFFTFSYDKYRFHTRYQNILPNFLSGSLINQLPHHIPLHNIERPRIQNYSWNMAGGHFLTFDTQNNNNNNPHWDFTNTTHTTLIEKLLTCFFKHCNPLFSIIHESTFWSQWSKFLSTPTDKTPNKLFQSILYLIIIITLRFTDGLIFNRSTGNNNPLLNQSEFDLLHKTPHLEQDLFNTAYSFIEKLTFEWESFELIQSWLLITFYLRTCYRQTATWNALSRAISLVKGMALDLNLFPTKHHIHDESKALHCFWSCFIMDKIISFQIGRQSQLDSPLNDMPTPRTTLHNKDHWPFHPTTQQMFDLAIIVHDFQQNKCFEMDWDSSAQYRQALQSWFDTNNAQSIDELPLTHLQPLMTYLDIRFNFELRSFFPLLDTTASPTNTTHLPSLPLDPTNLLSHCQLTIKIISHLCQEKMIFIPWWSTLSNLFSVTLIALTSSYLNLQTLSYRDLLRQIMPIWDQILNSDPWNPPIMAKQCHWCIKTLNHLISLVLQDTCSNLKSIIGTNPGDNTPNQNNFKQFSRVGDDEDVHLQPLANLNDPSRDPSSDTRSHEDPPRTDYLLTDDLLANLHWFDENFL